MPSNGPIFSPEPLDLLVVGGGIVGAGIARDAALRGLRVGLVEQYDFAFGTSSRSSRLLHGGIRYLAQGRIGLVKEANREKLVLQRIAPHLAQPLPFLFPTYSGTPWPLWKLTIGVKLYDWLCGESNLGPSSMLNREKTIARLNGALPEAHGLTGAVRYFDALTQDVRLVIDTLRSAAKQGAVLSNYTHFDAAKRANEFWECKLTRQVDGRDPTVTVKTRAIACAAGPWAQGLGMNQLSLRLTKGIHLVIDRARLPVSEAVVMTEGKRVLFAIPWGERVILGTTDTDYDPKKLGAVSDPIAHVSAGTEDIEYVLKITNGMFSTAGLGVADIISTWAGLRPLIADPNGSPSDISRSHEIRMSAAGWFEVAGGKLTTYRLMAEQTVDRVLQFLSKPWVPSRTAQTPLLSAEECSGVSAIVPPAFRREAVEHYCRNEWAQHLDDVMVRRGGWYHYCRERREMAEQCAEWMAQILNWNSEQRDAELSKLFKD